MRREFRVNRGSFFVHAKRKTSYPEDALVRKTGMENVTEPTISGGIMSPLTAGTFNNNRISVEVFVAAEGFKSIVDTGATNTFCSRKVAEQCENGGIRGKIVKHGAVIIANRQNATMKLCFRFEAFIGTKSSTRYHTGNEYSHYNLSVNLKTAECSAPGGQTDFRTEVDRGKHRVSH